MVTFFSYQIVGEIDDSLQENPPTETLFSCRDHSFIADFRIPPYADQ